MGKIVKHYNQENAPEMHKRYNYDIIYDGEGTRGGMLTLANYKPDATDVGLKPDTWILLATKED